jgi:lipoprotein-releasing system permease protein
VKNFFRYFLHYLFTSRQRQGVLFLAFLGLFLSSFSLIVIQGIMGGLQRGLLERSQKHEGLGVIRFFQHAELEEKLWSSLPSDFPRPTRELELELLIQYLNRLTPLHLHGVEEAGKSVRPPFLKEREMSGVVLGAYVLQSLEAHAGAELQFISPYSSESLMGEIPRTLNEFVSDAIMTEVSELDLAHGWVRVSFLQNLIRQKIYNTWRFWSREDFQTTVGWIKSQVDAKSFLATIQIATWEDEHQTLVWALGLETKVMLFLFASMSFLVAVSIASALFIFLEKVKIDLMSFWILGLSLEKCERYTRSFIICLTMAVSAVGVVMGLLVLKIIESFGHAIMPDFFIEARLPVEITFSSLFLSFAIPFGVSLLLTYASLAQFKNLKGEFLRLIRV